MQEEQPSASTSEPTTCTAASPRGIRARDPYPFPPKLRQMVRLPGRIGLFSHRGDMGQKISSPARMGPENPRAGPTVSMAIPTRDGPTSGQDSGTQASREPRRTIKSQPSKPWMNPREWDTRVSLQIVPSTKTESHIHTRKGSEITLGQFYLKGSRCPRWG